MHVRYSCFCFVNSSPGIPASEVQLRSRIPILRLHGVIHVPVVEAIPILEPMSHELGSGGEAFCAVRTNEARRFGRHCSSREFSLAGTPADSERTSTYRTTPFPARLEPS